MNGITLMEWGERCCWKTALKTHWGRHITHRPFKYELCRYQGV